MGHCPNCAASTAADAVFCPKCGTALATTPATTAARVAVPSSDTFRVQEALRASLAPRYELLQPLGHGGMGSVFLARETALKRLVAVKVLWPYLAADAGARARFEREGRAVAALSHPNIVSVYAVGETRDLELPYFIMQYVDGASLSRWIGERSKVSERDARRILGGIAAGLAAAHARGLIHRDVKPANILLEASSGRPFLADFGVTAVLPASGLVEDTKLTSSGFIVGTPVYMSPEQVAGGVMSPASDVYSFGIMAYELLTGELPFKATSAMGWAAAHLRDIPPPISQRRSDLAPDVARLIDHCLAKRPEDRPSAREVAQGLLPSLETEVQWPPPGLLPLYGRGRRPTSFALAAAVASLMLLVAFALPPKSVRAVGEWWGYYAAAQPVSGSPLGVRSEVPAATHARVPEWWIVTLALGLVGTGVGFLGLVLSSNRTFRAATRQRERGWRWGTLADVVADPDGRSGLLLVGAREFASLSADERRRILRARRALLWLRLAAGGWIPATLGTWAVLAVTGVWRLPAAGAVAGSSLCVLALLPAVAALGGALAVTLREARLLAPLPRRRHYTGTFFATAAGAGPREVAEWYATMPDPATPAAPGPRSRTRVLGAAHLVAVLVSLIALAALAAVAAAVVIAGRNVQRLGPETAELVAVLGRLDAEDPVTQARHVWQSYLPNRASIPDTALLAWVRALQENGQRPEGVPAYPVPPARLLGSTGSRSAVSAWFGSTQGASRRLPEDSARLLQTLADHSRTVLFRRLARATQIDLFAAGLDRPLARYETLAAVSEPPYGPLREAAQANVLSALLALSRRDFRGASERLGENAAVAEQLLRVPRLFAARFGAGMLQDLALLPLAEVEELQGHVERAGQLREAATRLRDDVYSRIWATRMAGLAADPRSLARFAAALRDERLLPGLRVDSFAGGFAGFCLNPGEILRGASPERRATVLGAADSMPSVAQASQLAELTSRDWEGLVGGRVLGRLVRCANPLP